MRLSHLTKIAAVASVIAAPLAVSGPASAATAPHASAYGIAASGLVNIPATPAAESLGAPAKNALVSLPKNKLLKLDVLSAVANASKGKAAAKVVDLKLFPANLSAQVITAKCHSDATGITGASNLVKVNLNGHVIKAAATPNTRVNVALDKLGVVSLVVNKQERTQDGLRVTALELSVPLGGGKIQTVSIASAFCGTDQGTPPASKPPTNTPPVTTPQNPAPAPTPVTGDLPVTG